MSFFIALLVDLLRLIDSFGAKEGIQLTLQEEDVPRVAPGCGAPAILDKLMREMAQTTLVMKRGEYETKSASRGSLKWAGQLKLCPASTTTEHLATSDVCKEVLPIDRIIDQNDASKEHNTVVLLEDFVVKFGRGVCGGHTNTTKPQVDGLQKHAYINVNVLQKLCELDRDISKWILPQSQVYATRIDCIEEDGTYFESTVKIPAFMSTRINSAETIWINEIGVNDSRRWDSIAATFTSHPGGEANVVQAWQAWRKYFYVHNDIFVDDLQFMIGMIGGSNPKQNVGMWLFDPRQLIICPEQTGGIIEEIEEATKDKISVVLHKPFVQLMRVLSGELQSLMLMTTAENAWGAHDVRKGFLSQQQVRALKGPLIGAIKAHAPSRLSEALEALEMFMRGLKKWETMINAKSTLSDGTERKVFVALYEGGSPTPAADFRF